MGVQEQIETRQVGERHKFCGRGTLLVSQGVEELEVQITDLLLRHGRNCIDWVKPAIKGRSLLKLFKAGFCELFSVLNLGNLLDERRTHW